MIRALLAFLLPLLLAAAPVQFTEVTAQAGIRFEHNPGKQGKKWLPETMGAGGAFFDFNNDGRLDILLINSKDWNPGKRKSLHALYRNDGNGKFTNVIGGSGLDVEMYGMGVAIGDYDNDGWDDVYITALENDKLFRNLGNGKFSDVTAQSGIANPSFGTSAAFLDYDKDGLLDLFVANYVQWSRDKDLWCSLDGNTKSYCTPESYKGASSKLYRNRGGGKFADVSRQAGIADPASKSLGVVVFDYNNDSWPDLFVANDTQPNKLYRNDGKGKFIDEGLSSGVAFDESGIARGAMGVDAADYDASGKPHLVIGNFSNQMLGLYHNEGSGLFVDVAPTARIGRDTLLTLAFGVFFFDYDLDGLLDLYVANGHIEEEIERVQPKVSFRQPPHLFHNIGKGQFEDVAAKMGRAFAEPRVARGAAYGDYDNDGDLDVLVTTNGGRAHLFRNDGGNQNYWLRIDARGTKSNRNGYGAIVTVTAANLPKQWRAVRSGSSYCSQSEQTVTFGLGKQSSATVQIEWPSGVNEVIRSVKANREYRAEEGKGLTPLAP